MNFELDCERGRPDARREAEGDTGRSTVEAEQRSSRPAAAARQPEGILLGALRALPLFLFQLASILPASGADDDRSARPVELRVHPEKIHLRGRDSRQSLLVTGILGGEKERSEVDL